MNLEENIKIPPSPNLVVPSLSIPTQRGSVSAPSNELVSSNSSSELYKSSDYLVMQEALSNEAVAKYVRSKEGGDAVSLDLSPPTQYTLAPMESLTFKSPRPSNAGVMPLSSQSGDAKLLGEGMRSQSEAALSDFWKSSASVAEENGATHHSHRPHTRSRGEPTAVGDNSTLVSPHKNVQDDSPSSSTDTSGDGFVHPKGIGRNYTSSFVYTTVMSPVKSGTFFGVHRLWHLVVWVVKRYTRFFLQCLRFYLGIYHGFRIVLDIYGLLGVHWIGRVGILKPFRWLSRQLFGGTQGRQITMLHRSLPKATSYEEWYKISERLDEVTGAAEWCLQEESTQEDSQDLYDSRALRSHLDAMRQARNTGNISEIVFLLRVCCNRHFCHLRNPSLYSVSFVHTKKLIEDFYEEVLKSLDYLNDHVVDDEDDIDTPHMQDECRTGTPVAMGRSRSIASMDNPASSVYSQHEGLTTRELLKLLSALRLSMGRTALCLSGGGALAVYHMGIIKALIENRMVPKVISGTSGGAISAGAMAIWNDDELMRQFLRPAFLEEHGLALCPPLAQQLKSLWSTGYLLDQKAYMSFVRSLYGEITFSEAFQRTGRFVSITTVPAGRSGPCEPLVCNCINTPDILVWSAVVASCALPLVLPPAALFTKSRVCAPSLRSFSQRLSRPSPACATCVGGRRRPADRAASPPSAIPPRSTGGDCTRCGTVVRTETRRRRGDGDGDGGSTRFVSDLADAPIEGDVSRYAPDSMLFVDGSILQDIPHTELQTLFNVKSFVVSQVNPHFTPFVQGPSGYRNQKGAVRWALDHLWHYLALDLRNRYGRLLALAIVPKIKGQDVSPFLMQAAEGHVTICPAPPNEFWKLTTQPTTRDVQRSIATGERKLWPYIMRLKHVLVVENKLKQLWVENLRRFEGRAAAIPRPSPGVGPRNHHTDKHLIMSRFRTRPSGSVVSAEELLG
eukprot:Gregarina_sp_Pseudo_9__3202@NODE_338_length_3112_cov_8_889034_g318_i0_p1_GENE_NODE_338_length_3112_cov_8_889034_g318_i0NODE_338_length_3112_cov_8_889034_g318_i0_p1_ORF_typecomplete_len957_score221_70DUF3336/PF11815_8/1_8e31Patatin/PF01734_22/8_3e03Patatin/PF01734_22/2_9e26_NODE_338_length_3112_cov_8_889034_g318_i0462916